MLRASFLVIWSYCLVLVLARSSPHAKNSDELLNNNGARYSTNVFEDANLDVPGLLSKYRYPNEVHTVITEDGYILEMHRIPRGRDRNTKPNVIRPVVFLMHGMLLSSADWVIMGPGSGFAYILAEEGFDVWMGNARGSYYSRKHVCLNPVSWFNTAFWQFSWDEIGRIDVPTMIDYVLQVTGQQRLHYVGHSQGTTTFFVMASLRPNYNEKIISMHALAPVAYMANNKTPLLLTIAPYMNSIAAIVYMLGTGEFLPNTVINKCVGEALCRDKVLTQELCSNILYLIGGWSEKQQNATMIPAVFGHAPAGSSIRQFAHYAQNINEKGFRRYNYGNALANFQAYGTFRPPRYDLSKVTAPVFLHYSNRDPFAATADVDILFRELGRPIGKFLIQMETFSHLDFVWGINAKQLVYDGTINLIKIMERLVASTPGARNNTGDAAASLAADFTSAAYGRPAPINQYHPFDTPPAPVGRFSAGEDLKSRIRDISGCGGHQARRVLFSSESGTDHTSCAHFCGQGRQTSSCGADNLRRAHFDSGPILTRATSTSIQFDNDFKPSTSSSS